MAENTDYSEIKEQLLRDGEYCKEMYTATVELKKSVYACLHRVELLEQMYKDNYVAALCMCDVLDQEAQQQ